MNSLFDRNLFTQVGLDSGAITMLGNVVHSFCEPGEYRGTVRTGDQPEAVFYVSVDPGCAVAQLNIDLATLMRPPATERSCCSGDDGGTAGDHRFVVHPRGYALFRVSSGPGGYSVNIRRADEDPELRAYDTRTLQPGDIFAGVLLRPGRYAIRNLLTKAHAEATVSYPKIGKTAFRPPGPLNIEVGEAIEPRDVHLMPAQGFNMRVKSPARIKIDLVKPDDGPGDHDRPGRPGWQSSKLPKDKG